MTLAVEVRMFGLQGKTSRPERVGPLLLHFVGEPFLFARTSYGDELVLHFGERESGPVRKIKGREWRYEHGTHRLHLRASAWLLKSGVELHRVLTGGLDREVQEVFGGTLIGPAAAIGEEFLSPDARVTAVVPFWVNRFATDGVGLRVEFSNGTTLVVIPTPPDPPEQGLADPGVDVADWEAVTPIGRLAVGPGRKATFTAAE